MTRNRFRIQTARRTYYTQTLAEARALAESIFQKTGIVVAIEEIR